MNEKNLFVEAMKIESANDLVAVTENGAVGFKETKSRLLDFFFHIGSMRNMETEDIQTQFAEAYAEDKENAIVCMFFARDCRGGMGEKRVFNICMEWLIKNDPQVAIKTIPLIPEYGSWKTFFELTDSFRMNKDVENAAILFFKDRVLYDMDIIGETSHGSISLMGKWMPSENTSSSDTRRLARYWRNVLKMTPREYRKMLSKFRERINIVEAKMSAGLWTEIDYNSVPAKAGQIYRNAFKAHDHVGYTTWLNDLNDGDVGANINVTGLNVADLVHKYMDFDSQEDPTIEAAWRKIIANGQLSENVPDMLPIIDGSGSMYHGTIGNSNLKAIDVSVGLGLYLANINKSAWKGMAIAYGNQPQFFNVPTNASLFTQVKIAQTHNDCGSTNIQAVYQLILSTAFMMAQMYHKPLSQEFIPQLVQFSDMEFDAAMSPSLKLFDAIKGQYEAYGLKLPKLFFWNINSRTNVVPIQENENGVGLLSGFSQSLMDMVLSHEIDPLKILFERLSSRRYNKVRWSIK